jgi:lysozyme
MINKKLVLIFCFLLTYFRIYPQNEIILKEVEIFAKAKAIIDTPKIYHGIDISQYQGSINWIKFDTSISFVICKATEGVKRIDPKFKKNWENIPTIKGCYHFFRPQYSGVEQAKNFLGVADLSSGNILPIIDVELTPSWKSKKYRKKYVQNLIKMVSYIEEETGLTPIIYTGAFFWDNYISKYYPDDKDHILWIADYRKLENPKTPKSMPEWTIWQYSCRGKVAGIPRLVDKNMCKNIERIIIKD